MRETEPGSVSAALLAHLRQDIAAAGGWIPFDRFMHTALYTPGLGYYARGASPIGLMPAGAPGTGPDGSAGSDFVTAPVLSPLFGRALAAQVAQGLLAAQADEVFEFGAGTGALAQQVLQVLGERVRRYTIVEVSGGLRAQQRQALAAFGERVHWAEQMPPSLRGVVLGNEVLDAMPARLLAFDGRAWSERGVVWHEAALRYADLPTDARPPVAGPFAPGTVLEIQPQVQAFVTTLAEHLERGLVLFIDYGFPEAELYHPQRTGGTLMCHRGHRTDGNPLADVGLKDITVHVDFTAVALTAQAAGLTVAGYTSQARFLLNCGIAGLLEQATIPQRAAALKLLTEHEMGELFKVIALTRGLELQPLGFVAGDRTHRL
ncbi:MAG: class I SAM-dependent methyltransferase [Rubrivivax sp.]